MKILALVLSVLMLSCSTVAVSVKGVELTKEYSVKREYIESANEAAEQLGTVMAMSIMEFKLNLSRAIPGAQVKAEDFVFTNGFSVAIVNLRVVIPEDPVEHRAGMVFVRAEENSWEFRHIFPIK